jgi:rhodanese-related sulfurtransferase
VVILPNVLNPALKNSSGPVIGCAILCAVSSFGRQLGFWLFLLSGGILVHGFDPETDGIQGIKDLVRKRFPEVSQLQTAELVIWLNDPNRPQPVLLDVREVKEFDVSHLPGATNVKPNAKAADLKAIIATGQPVVVYCSVGYRSSALAQRLAKIGLTNVFNLEGSIFQWANEGRPLVKNEPAEPAEKVHPYNKRYGVLLKPALRSED